MREVSSEVGGWVAHESLEYCIAVVTPHLWPVESTRFAIVCRVVGVANTPSSSVVRPRPSWRRKRLP